MDNKQLEGLLREAAHRVPAMSPELEAAADELEKAESVAWLVTQGRMYKDRAFISKYGAEKSCAERDDGAVVQALYATPPAPQVPDGYALVPVEPTQEILDEVCSAAGIEPWTPITMAGVYRAMLAAAQKAPGHSESATPQPDGWRLGNLLTMNQESYPGLGDWFGQIWDGDEVVARVYGKDHEEVRTRAAAVIAAAPQPEPSRPLKEVVEDFERNQKFAAAIKDGRIWVKSAPQPGES